MKRFLLLMTLWCSCSFADDLASLSDEFNDVTTMPNWLRLFQTEGWGTDQLETLDVDTTAAGHMRMMPHTSSWFNQLRGPLIYKELNGDFIVTARLRVSSRNDPNALPGRLFSLAGLMVQASRGVTSAAPSPYTPAPVWPPAANGSDWSPNNDNYISLTYGSAGNPGSWQYLSQSTLNSSSQVYHASSGVPGSGEIELQIVRVGGTLVTLRRHPGGEWIVENRYPNPDHPAPNFGETLRVGITAYTDWNNVEPYWNGGNAETQFHYNYTLLDDPGMQPDLIADVDYIRFNRPSPALTEAMLQALPTSYNPATNQSNATALPAGGAADYLGDNAGEGLAAVGFVETSAELGEVPGSQTVLNVARYGDVTQPLSVQVVHSGGTGSAVDFNLLTPTLEWPAGDSDPRQVLLEVLPDEEHEIDETLILSLQAAPGVLLQAAQATVTILDDDITLGFPNIPRTAGELIAGLIAPTQGRTAVLAYHNSVLYSIPEAPSSVGPSDMQVRTWDISNPAVPVETAQLGPTSHPINAHGYFKRDNFLSIGPNWPPEAPWSFRADGPGVTTRTTVPGSEIPGQRGQLYAPWRIVPTYTSYFPSLAQAEIWRDGQLLSSWDHLAETGVFGHPILIGNILFFASDQNRSGVASYDISDPEHPALLDVLKTGGPGGYWPEPFAIDGHLYIVFPYRTGGNGIRVVDVTDPSDMQLIADVPLPGDECMYVQFQDEYAFVGSHKVDMRTFTSVLNFDGENTVRTNDGGVGIDTSQYAMPLGNLVVTGGSGPFQGMAIWAHQDEPDTRGPAVAFHIPRAGQTGYPLSGSISLLIHENLETPTIRTGHTLIVRPVGGEAVSGTMVFTFNDTLTFTPDKDLLPDTTYEVILPEGGIKDAAGNGMEGYQFTFSTGESVSGNLPPSADALETDLYPALVGDLVTATAQGSDPEENVLEYRFDWGDGSPRTDWGANASASHSYVAPGHYSVLVQVRDDGGLTATRRAVVTVLAAPVPAQRPRSSVNLIVDEAGRRVYTVNPDNDTLTAMDADTLEIVYEVPVARGPQSVTLDDAGNLWIAASKDDVLEVVRASDGQGLHRYVLGYGARPAHVVAYGNNIWVSLQGAGELRRYNTVTGQPTGSVPLGPEPRALALNADASRMFVTRFISDIDHAQVWEVNPQTMTLVRTLSWQKFGGDDHRDGTANGRGVANYLASAALNIDGSELWIAAKKDNTDRGLLNGLDLNTENTVRAVLMRIDTASGAMIGSIDIDNSDSPSALAFSPLGDYLLVTLQGNNALMVFDAFNMANTSGLGSLVANIPVGDAPQGVAMDSVTGRGVVKNFLGRSLHVLEMQAFLSQGQIGFESEEVPVVTMEHLSPMELIGKRIFYNAVDERMSAEGYISCATCHFDGGSDGRVWDFTGRGEGLRRTTDLRGRGGLAHGGLHWSGNFDELQDFEHDIRNAFGGSGFMSDEDFANTNTPLGASKAGLSAELDALAAYVSSLAGKSVPRSPHRQENGELTPAAFAGETVFTTQNCAVCHTPDTYTDSALPGGTLHNVGTLRASSGQRLGAELPGIDTPTLRGLHAQSRFLHDGSALSLEEVFTRTGGITIPAEEGVVSAGATVVSTGVPFPAVVPSTHNFPVWSHRNWRHTRFEDIPLDAGEKNVIEIGATVAWPRLSIDEIQVSRPEDLAQAQAHRTVLSISPAEREQLVAYILSLDGGGDDHAYMAWGMDKGLTDIHPDSDEDGDLITLNGEWMRGMDPVFADADLAKVGFELEPVAGGNELVITFRRGLHASGVIWRIQTTENLEEDWEDLPSEVVPVETVFPGDADGETVEWRVQASEEVPRLFLRMVGNLQP
jgi:DNA-binding beta-propeller fold protein YncE